jgi:hypothetical protein
VYYSSGRAEPFLRIALWVLSVVQEDITVDPQTLQPWLNLISGTVAIIAGLVAAFWAYTKFVLERGLLPPVQFNVECESVGLQGEKTVLEILLNLKNLGTATLVATNIRVDVRYLDVADAPSLFENSEKATFGRLRFPRSLQQDLLGSSEGFATDDQNKKPNALHGIPILRYDTFVQPGVDQTYTFVTAVPKSTTFVRIFASFEYALHPSRFQRAILVLSRRFGLIQYSLDHVRKPHTAERIFHIISQ